MAGVKTYPQNNDTRVRYKMIVLFRNSANTNKEK